MAEPALNLPNLQENERANRMRESQALAMREANAGPGPDWRPAGSPQAGSSGALSSQPLSDNQIPQNVSLPPVIRQTPSAGGTVPMPYPNEEADEELELQLLEDEVLAAAAAQAAEDQELQRLAESTATSTLEDDARDKIREEVKRTAKAGFKRAIIYLVDFIGGCLDLGTATMSMIIDIFVYIFTFSWLNLEMIYGSYIAKGKSKLISPLTWAPIPFPGDKNGILLHGALIAADLLLLLAVVCVFGFGLLLLYVAASAMENSYGTIFSLITGSGELGFLGDLFKTWIGI